MGVGKKKILLILGESGSGKTYAAQYIEHKYKIPMIKSHTDREQRKKGDTDHTYHTKESFDKIKKEDMIAYTEWQGNRYCCLEEDVRELNTYVIDESGMDMLMDKYADVYDIGTLRIYRNYFLREKSVGKERIDRDKGKFKKEMFDFDYVIQNDFSYLFMNLLLDNIVSNFFLPPIDGKYV